MSATFTSTGIVLGWEEYREADRRYALFTREHGKIEAVARGSQKPLAKLSPHLELPAETDFLLVHGRQYTLIAGAERQRIFPSLTSDISRFLLARNGLHLVDIGTRAEQPDSVLYELIIDWLAFLDESPDLSPERAGFALASFALKLLSTVGYRPQLLRCLSCEMALVPGAYRWHALKGGAVCSPCAERSAENWFAARLMSDEVLKLLRFALDQDFSAQLRPHLPGEILTDFHEAVESLVVSHFPAIPASSLRAACAF